MKLWVATFLGLSLVASACSSAADRSEATTSQPAPTTAVDSDVASPPDPTVDDKPPAAPRFEPAAGSLAALVGNEFDGDALPADLQPTDSPERPWGASIINHEANPGDDEVVAMHWAVRDGHANFTVSRLARRNDSGSMTWTPLGAWVLVLDQAMILSIGTDVCAAPIESFDWRHGEFIAVTNRSWNVAFGAWTMTKDGPAPYSDPDELHCEEFVP